MPTKKTTTKRKPREVRYRGRVEIKETATVLLPLEIGKKLGGSGEKGRIPVRVTIEGIPFYSLLYMKTVFDPWEAENNPVGFELYLSAEMCRYVPVSDGQELDLLFVREEHTVRQRRGRVPKKLL
ncbi:MAG: hypothetical protein JRH01_18235 [Deltaproteobacteria bacterium]|nr:hypothetical protein [Deltaproteobacteria bacterium]MBW2396457.1 hypothetical protein [Deltaproteobacteria bacterium]